MRLMLLSIGALIVGASTMRAQDPQCPFGSSALSPERITQDACQKAIDLYKYMAPQLGTVVAGGNATLGQGGTLGGPGHFTLSVRANALQGSVPLVEDVTPSTGGANVSTYEVKDQVLAMPAVDAAIGVFKGLPLGLTSVGGVDLLLSAAYLPEFERSGVTVQTPEGGLKLGYGARIGLLEESFLIPGVSFTYLRRDFPTVTLSASTTSGDLHVRDLSVETSSWRVVASKSLLTFGLAAGAGQDSYSSSAVVQATVNTTPSDEIRLKQDLTRTNYFLDVYMNIFLLKLIGEIGVVQGGQVETFNQFDGKQPDASRLYGSIGFRVGL